MMWRYENGIKLNVSSFEHLVNEEIFPVQHAGAFEFRDISQA